MRVVELTILKIKNEKYFELTPDIAEQFCLLDHKVNL